MIYLDNAATTLHKPKEVQEAVIAAFGRWEIPEEGHRSRRLRHWEQSTMQEKRWHGFFMPKMRVRLCLPQILQRR